VEPPEIVGLSEESAGPIDLASIDLNADPASASRAFRWFLSHWTYFLTTAPLPPGTYTLTLRIAGRKDYVTGFVLR
jgi:hypothetical protein